MRPRRNLSVGKRFDIISVGVGNLLINTGFTGDYTTIDLSVGSKWPTDTTLFSDPLKFWTVSGAAAAGEEARSQSGFACTFSGTLSQSPIAAIEAEQDYTVSVWAKGTGTLAVKVGGASGSFALTSAYQKFVVKLKATDTSGFSITASASATIYELKLERGTVATDWSPSSSDNDKSEAQAISYKYVLDAIQNETDIYGGLVLTNILMVGNYTNGKMTTVTGGLSGVYHDGNDVAFWAGGTLEQAIRAVGDPSRTSNVANAVITHGGLAILNNSYVRGKIYATDGEFRGTVYANAGILQNMIIRTTEEGQRIELNPTSQSISLYNAKNLLVGNWHFEDTGGAIELFYTNSIGSSRVSNSLLTGFELQFQTQNGSMLGSYSYSNVYLSTTGKSFYVSLNASDGLSVILEGLPKSKDNLASGRIYVDGDTLKIA